MNIKQHIRMTASEIAMGRYMRAPDHPTGQEAADEFAAAFDQFGTADDKKPVEGADDKGGGDGSGAAAAAADGPGGGAADSGAGSPGADSGAAPAGEDDKKPAEAGADDKKGPEGAEKSGEGAGDGKSGEPGGDAKPAAGADDKKPAAAADDKKPAAEAGLSEADADALLKRLATKVKEAPAGEDKKPAAEVEEKPIFSAEEEAKIEHFKKEWPEVAEAFDLQARALAHSVLKYAFGQIAEQFIPLRETVEVLATRTHYGDLKEKVGDYNDAEREAIIDWVGTQPKYLQAPMLSVIEEGTAEEVADLVSRYRTATGKQPAGAQDDKKAAPGGDVELSGEAKKAAEALAPVKSKRSDVQAAEDTSNFDAAFDKFVNQPV